MYDQDKFSIDGYVFSGSDHPSDGGPSDLSKLTEAQSLSAYFNSQKRMTEEEVKGLHKAISKLTKKQKEVIELIFFNGLGIRECARYLTITVYAVQCRLKGAIKILGKNVAYPTGQNPDSSV